MWDQQIYEDVRDRAIEAAVRLNQRAIAKWEADRETWLHDAAWNKANKRPLPPKPEPPARRLNVIAPPWTLGIEQWEIKTVATAELVADPACDLPPDPVPGPPGIVDVGGKSTDGPPAVYACGPKDTAAPGALAEKDGKKLVKVVPAMSWAGLRAQWYQEVV